MRRGAHRRSAAAYAERWAGLAGARPALLRRAVRSRLAKAFARARAQADVSGNGYLEGAEVGRILERMRAGGRGVTAGEVRNVMRQARPACARRPAALHACTSAAGNIYVPKIMSAQHTGVSCAASVPAAPVSPAKAHACHRVCAAGAPGGRQRGRAHRL